MRILLVNYRYFISGGPEKYMFNVKKMLEDHGHEVVPFSIHSNKNVKTEYSKYFVEPIGGRNVTYYDEYKKTPKTILKMISRSFYSFEVKKAIQREIKEIKPDLVYIIHYVNKLSPSVIRGAKQMGMPVVCRLSDYFLLCPRFDFLYKKQICEECLTKGYNACIRKKCVKGSLAASIIRVCSMKFHKIIKVYRDVDVFITPSEFLKKKLMNYGFPDKKIICVPTFTVSGTEIEEFCLGTYGLYFGRITEEKGVETVVKAYEKIPDHQVKIMGDDTTEEAIRLKKYVKKRGLSNIEFLGFKTGNELERVVKNARFTMVPSVWYDNLPNTVLESFQYYKPVIASDIGSLPELVTDSENGYLFEVGNSEKLAEKICLLDDDELVKGFGINARKKLKEHFSQEKHYHNLMCIFKMAKKKCEKRVGEKRNG